MIQLPFNSFFYARHGKTVDNTNGIVSGGERDTFLTDEGKAGADAMAPQLEALSDEISCIFCSPMGRAQETAERGNARAHKEIITISNLYEWMVGDLAGKRDADYSAPLSNWTLDPPGGESRAQLVARVQRALHECGQRHQGREGIPLIVAHAGLWWGLTHALGLPHEPIDNCQLFRVERQGSVWSAKPALG